MPRGGPWAKIRIDQAEWDEFGSDASAAGTDRSALLREFMRWWMRKPGAKLPPRLPQ